MPSDENLLTLRPIIKLPQIALVSATYETSATHVTVPMASSLPSNPNSFWHEHMRFIPVLIGGLVFVCIFTLIYIGETKDREMWERRRRKKWSNEAKLHKEQELLERRTKQALHLLQGLEQEEVSQYTDQQLSELITGRTGCIEDDWTADINVHEDEDESANEEEAEEDWCEWDDADKVD